MIPSVRRNIAVKNAEVASRLSVSSYFSKLTFFTAALLTFFFIIIITKLPPVYMVLHLLSLTQGGNSWTKRAFSDYILSCQVKADRLLFQSEYELNSKTRSASWRRCRRRFIQL